jgi:hypothetical protein
MSRGCGARRLLRSSDTIRKENAVSARQDPAASSDDETTDLTPDMIDAFAGLTGIDVVDGELIPRERREHH